MSAFMYSLSFGFRRHGPRTDAGRIAANGHRANDHGGE
jgi:hypothetical protein